MARRAGVVPFSLTTATVNVEGSQGVSRHSPQRVQHMPPPAQGGHVREVVPATHHREMHTRAQSLSAAQGGPPRRDVYSGAPASSTGPPPLAPAPPPHHQQATIHPPTGSPMAPIKLEYGEPTFAPSVPGPGLAPIQAQPRQRTGDYLPGIAELTTGVGPYGHGGNGAQQMPVGGSGQISLAPGTQPPGPPQPPPSYQGYQPMEPMRLKRRASTDAGLNEPNSRRRLG